MIRSTFKQFIKLLRQNRFFTFLNLFGISITIMIIMIMDIQLENTIWPVGSESKKNQMALFKDIVIEGEEWMRSGGFTQNIIENYLMDIETPHTLAFSAINYGTYLTENKTVDYIIRYTNNDFWNVFDFEFISGRPFNNEEIKNESKVAVISDRLAKYYFNGEDAINKTMEVDGEPFKIMGVVKYVSKLCEESHADLWLPYTFAESGSGDIDETGAFSVSMLLENMDDMPKLKEEIAVMEKKITNKLEEGEFNIRGPYDAVENYFVSNSIRSKKVSKNKALLNLALKWLLILIIPAINLISINVSRVSERASEIGVRKAFGATKISIIKKSLLENTFLTLLGALIGLGLAIAGVEMFKEKLFSQLFDGEMILVKYSVNMMSFLICLIAALLLSALSGLIPAFLTSKQQPAKVLKGGAL